MIKEHPPLTMTIMQLPAGGFVVLDGRNVDSPMVLAKTSLREVQNAVSDFMGEYFLPPPEAIDESETFEPPRMMRDTAKPQRSFFKAIMGGKS